MRTWQKSMIRLARSRRVVDFAQRCPPLDGLAQRFVSGTSAQDAIAIAEQLRAGGISTTFFFLGEYVTDRTVIDETVRQLEVVTEQAAVAGLDVNVSVDPTQVGLMVDAELAEQNLHRLGRAVAAATNQAPRPGHDTVMIDMEDVEVTQTTLEFHRSLRSALLPAAVTVQAYLYRTDADLGLLVGAGAWVRLVKGAFAEDATVAARRKTDIDSQYRRAAALLLGSQAQQTGVYPSFATHDARLIREVITTADANGWAPDQYEFEMLHGVRPDLQEDLAQAGHRVRVCLPFGQDWFPYTIRRVGESARNLRFAVANLSRRA